MRDAVKEHSMFNVSAEILSLWFWLPPLLLEDITFREPEIGKPYFSGHRPHRVAQMRQRAHGGMDA